MKGNEVTPPSKRRTSKRVNRKLLNQFYIKYYLRDAGNDSPVLECEIDRVLDQLEKLLR
jgi:hypothetical protein